MYSIRSVDDELSWQTAPMKHS